MLYPVNFRKLFCCLAVAFVIVACNEKIFTGNVDCDQCYVEMQSNADLIIDLTINSKYPAVPLTVYYGDVEGNDIVFSDTAFASPFYVYVRVNRKYSVKAEYRDGNELILAVDGTNLKILSVADACEERCFIIENANMDVRLKKEFP